MFTNKKLEDDFDCKAIFPKLFKVEKLEESVVVAAITISQSDFVGEETRTLDRVSVVIKMKKLEHPVLDSKDAELSIHSIIFMCENIAEIILSESALNLTSVDLKLDAVTKDWHGGLLSSLKKASSFSSTPTFHRFDETKAIKFKIEYNYDNIKKVIGYIA
jgi:hypothetical protein